LTVNFAGPGAIPWVGLLLAILALPTWIVTAKGAATRMVLVTEGAALAVVCLLCACLSSRTKCDCRHRTWRLHWAAEVPFCWRFQPIVPPPVSRDIRPEIRDPSRRSADLTATVSWRWHPPGGGVKIKVFSWVALSVVGGPQPNAVPLPREVAPSAHAFRETRRKRPFARSDGRPTSARRSHRPKRRMAVQYSGRAK